MAAPQFNPTSTRLRFGVFEADLSERALFRQGARVHLQEQPFELLCVLLERPNETVSREQLRQRLWPDHTFVEYDDSLNTAVRKLRAALSDRRDQPRFVETVARHGYRFIAPVTPVGPRPMPMESFSSWFVNRPLGAGITPLSSAHKTTERRQTFWRAIGIGIILAVALVIATALFGLRGQHGLVPLSGTTKLTEFGLAWANSKIVSDGERLYFGRREGSRFDIVQVAVSGGSPVPLPTPFSGVVLFDISPDRGTLLIGANEREWAGGRHALWLLSLVNGAVRRVTDAFASDAAWCQDGRIFFANGLALFSTSIDGSAARKVTNLAGPIQHLTCSPASRVLRFSMRSRDSGSFSLWEVSTDGSSARPMLSNWKPDAGWLEGEYGGTWTADGKEYVFTSTRGGVTTLWSLAEGAGRWSWFRPAPRALYSTPLFFATPAINRGGTTFFVLGDEQESREVTRFDPHGRFSPFLPGVPARWVRFSPDHHWLAYIQATDLTLWRCRADGSDRLQLTYAPMRAFTPNWSPDNEQLAFAASVPGQNSKIYVVSRDGGLASPVWADDEPEWDPNWTADGKSLIFGRIAPSFEFGRLGILQADLVHGRPVKVPGSDEFTKPALAPNQRYIAALTGEGSQLLLFDRRNGRWSTLATGKGLQNVYWSHDSRYIYVQDVQAGREQPVFRVRVASGVREPVVRRDQLQRSDVRSFALNGLAPDNSILLTLIRGRADLFALSRGR